MNVSGRKSMNRIKLSGMLVLCALVFYGCAAGDLAPVPGLEGEEASSVVALTDFFQALREGDYERAVELYGGPYTTLEEYNPDLDPQDRAKLLARACQVNGFVCLSVGEVVAIQPGTYETYNVSVTFLDEDGTLFVREGCCGESSERVEPQSVFTFEVKKEAGRHWRVMNLPVYIP